MQAPSPCITFITALLLSPILLAQTPEQIEFFEKKVRPVLVSNCQACHNPKVKTSGLDMSSGEGFFKGGNSGALVSKDSPEHSSLLRAISYEGQLKMPPAGKLKDDAIAVLTAWVKMGAPWPGAVTSEAAASSPSKGERRITDAERRFWAFQPVRKPMLPTVQDAAWVSTPVDRFILAKLEQKGLRPAPRADKEALLRRVTFDLTGLPPTEEELRSFLADQSSKAFETVVDRLLNSPRYGEKWGRNWLDVARYADSTGNDEDHRYPYAWRYRDYVIDAFNSDMPYDQFVREQIAGDLMPPSKPGEVNRRGIVATGFLALGAKAIAQQDKKKMLYDVYDEQLDVTTRTILGATVACARCHDHKFDPFLTKDYYSLISIFASTKSFKEPDKHVSELLYTPLVPTAEYKRYTDAQERVNLKNTEIEDLLDQQAEKYTAALTPRLAEYMLATRRVTPEKDAAAVAKEMGLLPAVLEKWVKYLEPGDESRVHLEEWKKASAENATEVARAYQSRFEKRAAEWSAAMAGWRSKFSSRKEAELAAAKPKFEASDDRFFAEVYFGGPLGVGKKQREQNLPDDVKVSVGRLKAERDALKAALPPEPDMACAVQEGPVVNQKVFVRGDYNSPGVDAPKAFPLVMAGENQPTIENGSGRLELAQWLSRPDHPLTPRVMANRVWLWHFGEGIVRTPDNFGKMGERPTHPELLDYLASSFVENGWSVKRLHRLIVLSSSYQMSTAITDDAVQADPENRLFSRFPRRRLTVEELRDGLLAADGSLDTTMGGTLQSGFGTDGENSNGRLSLRPETNRRRMVYLPLRRANLPSLLNLFDFGDATTASGKRTLTTVAPQALFMMNSEFIAEHAKKLSQDGSTVSDPKARLRRLYVKVLNREPKPDEVDNGLTYISNFQTRFAGKRSEPDAWFTLARLLIASNDFIYLD